MGGGGAAPAGAKLGPIGDAMAVDGLDLDYCVDEHDIVWEIRDGDTRRIGPKDRVFEEWANLMATEDFGE
jgi:hypothetical protein